MIVSVSGFNCTGSSAVIDLLKEYDEIKCFETELMFIHFPDGIIDLDYQINNSSSYLNGDVGIQRFKTLMQNLSFQPNKKSQILKVTDDYLNSLISATWHGHSTYDGTRLRGFAKTTWNLKRCIGIILFHYFHSFKNPCNRKMYLAYNNDSFDQLTGKYIERIANILIGENDIQLFNQFFSAYNPRKSMKYNKDAKMIVVNRDPRDIYIVEKIKRDTLCFPSDRVENYIAYQLKSLETSSCVNTPNVLYVQFEDLIYKYEETKALIETFLKIKTHSKQFKFFNPSVSINNTQLKYRYPALEKDIELIETKMSKWLYPFPYRLKPKGDFF